MKHRWVKLVLSAAATTTAERCEKCGIIRSNRRRGGVCKGKERAPVTAGTFKNLPYFCSSSAGN